MSDDAGADLVFRSESVPESVGRLTAGSDELGGALSSSGSVQGAAGEAMGGWVPEAGAALDNIHEIADGALRQADDAIRQAASGLQATQATMSGTEHGIISDLGGIHPDGTVPGGDGTASSGTIAEALSGAGGSTGTAAGVPPEGVPGGSAAAAGAGVARSLSAEGTAAGDTAGSGLADAAGNASSAGRGRGDIPTAGDPVDVATGDVIFAQADVTLPGVLPLVLERVHRSSHRTGRWLGRSWLSSFDQRLEILQDRVIGAFSDGRVLTWPRPASGEAALGQDGSAGVLPVTGPCWPLRQAGDTAWTVTDPQQGLAWRFESRPGHWYSGTGGGQGELPLVSVTDRSGHAVVFEYSDSGEPAAVTHSGGYRIEVARERGRITALALADGEGGSLPLVRYQYEGENLDLAGVVNSSGQPLRFSYDLAGRLTGWTDRTGNSYRYFYDDLGRCVRGVSPSGVQSGTFGYQPGITRWTDGTGAVTVYEIDESSRITGITDPLRGVTQFRHDERGRVTMLTDALGRVTRYAYDRAGNLVAVTRPDGAVARAAYDERSLLLVAAGPGDTEWRQEYDSYGNRTALTAPDGSVTRYAYDASGHLAAVTTPDGLVTRVTCNAAGLPTAVTGPDGNPARYERDRLGRVMRFIAPGGAVTELSWTAEGQPAARTLPDGTTETWTYDADGHLARHVSPAGAVTTLDYGPFDIATAVTWPDGTRTQFGYDAELRLTHVTHGGLTWRYEYDPAGRVTAETDYNGAVTRHWHDAAGQLTRKVNAAGQETCYGYDALGNVTATTSDGSQTTFGYDAAGRLVRAGSADAEIVLTRDRLGRVISESCDGRTITFGYDTGGRVSRRVTPSGAVTSWLYDAAGRPAAMAAGGAQLRFGYDSAGRETSRELPGGVTLTQDWDPRGRLTTQILTGPGTVPGREGAAEPRQLLQRRAYAYSPDSFVTGIEDMLTGNRTVSLDPAGRILGVTGPDWAEQYSYDPLGTVTSAAWPAAPPGLAGGWLDAGPQGTREVTGTLVTRAGNVRYRYDAAGRVVTRTRTRISRKPETWQYTWDCENRLTAVTTPDGATWRYRYDPLGRRIAKRHIAADGRILAETRFAWDGTVLVEQAEIAGPDGVPGPVTTWDYQPGSFTPLAQTSRMAQSSRIAQPSCSPLAVAAQDEIDQRFYAIITDLAGTPAELAGPDASVAGYQQHTVWGAAVWHSPGASTPLRFPGQYADPETGLHYNNQRYYDPVSGAYLSPDPLGLAPAPSPHAYVANPHVMIDPLGLEPGPLRALAAPKTATELRNSPGPATGGYSLPRAGANWLRGSEGNLGRIPGQIADQLRGQTFETFGDFRRAFWKAVAKDPDLSPNFSASNLTRMSEGYAAHTVPSQQLPDQLTYQLHHATPIHAGGGVYDMDNIKVTTPLLHSQILDPQYHYGAVIGSE